MSLSLFPREYIESVYDFDFDRAKKLGVKAILFDIDNTFVPHGAPADKKAIELLNKLRTAGFKLCAISNNAKDRVSSFCKATGSNYVFKACKPSPKGFIMAMNLLKVRRNEVIFFGDQLFTDILGANRARVYSVLVKPIDRSTDIKKVRLKRILEKPFIKHYLRDKKLALERYYM